MNKLIIIGNGFDLAHGLPTSYNHFLNDIWRRFPEITSNELFRDLFNVKSEHINFESYESYHDFLNKSIRNYNSGGYRARMPTDLQSCLQIYFQHPYLEEAATCIFNFKNKLFELITVNNLRSWVDIEKIYYDALLSLVKSDNKFSQFKSIDQLNSEFRQIKNLLNNYIKENVEEKYDYNNNYEQCKSIVDIFRIKYTTLEFPINYHAEIRKWKFNSQKSIQLKEEQYTTKNLFVDFNYTSNVANYINIINSMDTTLFGTAEHIHIHGEVHNDKNPINFGFGDEMDEHYKILETTGDNRFLENIKSFMYFNNSNYRRLLNWVGSNDYQIYIMGHSCGLSDRTLLNTLFEHQNCKSIKIFYHQKKDGSDNFTELTQNISRHFNKKGLMREKIVAKSLSTPLPQDVRYQHN